ncbi:MAG: RHS repeat domain-containing protein [Thermoanaerobaculia bacterium]
MKSELYSVQHTSRRPSAWLFIVLVLAAASVAAQTPTTILDLGPYTYDGSGNITSIGNDSYVYDAYGRLVSGTAGPGKSQTYTYDQFGNLLTITTDNDTAAMIKLGVSPTTNRISVSSAPYNAFGTYDNAGNMISTPRGDAFTYDALGMAKSSSDGVTTKLYIYTPNEERIAVIDTVAGTKTGTAWTIRDSGGAPLRRFKESPSGTTSWDEDYVYQGGKLLVAEVAGPEQQRHFFSDHLGTPRLITDTNGYELSRHTYYPFGREVTPPQDGEVLKFTGHERDRPTLDYMHARYYENGWGRFLSVDPMLDVKRASIAPQMWNRYAYVRNNPISALDPDGRSEFRLDNQLGREQLAVVSGQMSMDKYLEIQRVRFEGANAASALVGIGEAFSGLRSAYALARAGFSAEGRAIIGEAVTILRSQGLRDAVSALKAGVDGASFTIGKYEIVTSTELSASAMTFRGENGAATILLGKGALTSNAELAKTVVHELYRLIATPAGVASVESAPATTKLAFDFAEAAVKFMERAGLVR